MDQDITLPAPLLSDVNSYSDTTIMMVAPDMSLPDIMASWELYFNDEYEDASYRILKGPITSEELINEIETVNTNEMIFLFNGHGGKGVVELADGLTSYDKLFSPLFSKNVPLTVIIDACYSGSAFHSFKKFADSQKNVRSVLLTSASENEKSYALRIVQQQGKTDRNEVSFLSRAMLLSDEVPSTLEGYDMVQHPQLWIAEEGGELTQIELNEVLEVPYRNINKKGGILS